MKRMGLRRYSNMALMVSTVSSATRATFAALAHAAVA